MLNSSGISQQLIPTYQHVVVTGVPYRRGLMHGVKARNKVRANVEYYKQPGKLASLELMSKIITDVYIPSIEKYYPSGLQEMKGIADGAGVTLEDIILLNARYDLARLGDHGEPQPELPPSASTSGVHTPQDDVANECTSAFFLKEATKNGDVINAQNWDMSGRLWIDDAVIYLEVHPDPSENKPSMFLVTEAGQLGRSGMNSLGIGVTANSLMSTDDYVPVSHLDSSGTLHEVDTQTVLPISLLRRMVLECNHVSEAFTAVHNFPRHVSNNLTIATAEGFGVCLEITPDRVYKVYRNINDPYLTHTNHFSHPGFESRADIRDKYPGGSSWFRRQRFEEGIRPYTSGQLTKEHIISAFSDHLSYPEAVCSHPEESPDVVVGQFPAYPFRSVSATVACVLYNLTQHSVTVCKGPPCQGVFQTFELKRKEIETSPGVLEDSVVRRQEGQYADNAPLGVIAENPSGKLKKGTGVGHLKENRLRPELP
ncbi:peptidase C45 acyl-coenzyme A:6-aminopenicillanic acid acyl-transferase [Stipitochalara longipes BDJ]|nr:peptidase C45 acyl-coenzyme A:6-aminopenicillanic acid acyl-transferase [Stipitochalara longipes BDJ]